MLAELMAAGELFGDALSRTDPRLLSGVECAQVVEVLARVEKQSAAMRALAAAWAAECGAHKSRGYSSAARWLADTAGTTTGAAKAALDTATGLDDCPQTKEALLAGDLSIEQAHEITKTEAALPGSETKLLELAATAGVNQLKEEARRQRLEAQDPNERHHRQRQERHFRHWADAHGMIRGTWALPPETGVPVVNILDTATDRLIRAARRDSDAESEPRERLAADAFAQLILDRGQPTEGNPKAPGAEVILVCDIAAFQRGHTEGEEICHVIGGGPVPVSVAREMATAAFIKAVLHNGTRIETIAHLGRYRNAKLRTALGLGDPPLFTGAACADCGRRYGLQWDHVDPVNNHGPTSYDNLQALCWPCHHDKTERDRKAGLLGPHRRSPSTPARKHQTSPPSNTSNTGKTSNTGNTAETADAA